MRALWSNEMSMSSESDDDTNQDEDRRARWERPAFRRLVANLAEQGVGFKDEGNCVGGQQGSMICMS
jgi:hypothetical protein